MSLKPRLRRLEAQVEWLDMWGEYRLAKAELDYRDMKQKVMDALARDPDAAAKWAAAGYPKEFLPPRAPTRPPPTAHSHAPQAPAEPPPAPPVQAIPPASAPMPPEPPKKAEVPSPPTSPAPPTEPFVQPFEPIQNGLVRWRVPGAGDDRDDDEEDRRLEDEDYDVFADDV
ncbi:MAG: hypothetical protein ACHQK9_15185 [Reyranellales bacterium]